MRGAFFMWLAVGLVGLIVAYFIWTVLYALFKTAVDIKTGRELDRLAEEYAEKRDQRQRDAVTRLETGCDHEFDDDGGALPPDVCRLCGIAKEKPPGKCDHRWKKLPGIIPQSQCAACGETYSPVHGV